MGILTYFKRKELQGTCVQICIVALLLPFIAVLFGIILGGQGKSQQDFVSALISYMPYSNELQGIFSGAELVSTGTTLKSYLAVVWNTVQENAMLAIYVGMWIRAFRVIFKEIVPLKGLPLIQIICGLLFGALSLTMVNSGELGVTIMVTGFIIILNLFLSIVFVRKSVGKKILDVVFISFECFFTPMISGYIVAFGMVFKGYITDLWTGISVMLIATGVMLLYALIQYLMVVKKDVL